MNIGRITLPHLDRRVVASSALKTFAPRLFSGIIEEMLSGKTIADVEHEINNGTLWDKISPIQQEWLLRQRPWQLDWLNLDYVIGSVAMFDRSLAYAMRASPRICDSLEHQISAIKEHLEQPAP